MALRDRSRAPARRARTLFLLAVLLFGSATLRLGIEAGPVLAQQAIKQPAPTVPQAPATTSPALTPERLQPLLDVFNAREEAIRQSEIEIEDRFRALEIAEAAIDQKLAALVQAEEALSATLALADGASEKDLDRLVSVYEKMKPKDAAILFEEMDPKFSAGFLARMRPELAAGIMSGLSPEAAYTISVVLAGRHADVPQD